MIPSQVSESLSLKLSLSYSIITFFIPSHFLTASCRFSWIIWLFIRRKSHDMIVLIWSQMTLFDESNKPLHLWANDTFLYCINKSESKSVVSRWINELHGEPKRILYATKGGRRLLAYSLSIPLQRHIKPMLSLQTSCILKGCPSS